MRKDLGNYCRILIYMSNSTHPDLQGSRYDVPPHVQAMIDNAVPIWEVLGLSETHYFDKYVKPYMKKACEVVEEICEEVKIVADMVEETAKTFDENHITMSVCSESDEDSPEPAAEESDPAPDSPAEV